jgi:hypothetical protein
MIVWHWTAKIILYYNLKRKQPIVVCGRCMKLQYQEPLITLYNIYKPPKSYVKRRNPSSSESVGSSDPGTWSL